MSVENLLTKSADDHEEKIGTGYSAPLDDPPQVLKKYIRNYFGRLVDYRKLSIIDEKLPHLNSLNDGLNELMCPELAFLSGARLEFSIRFRQQQTGWLVTQFMFHLTLPSDRGVGMVRIHLNEGRSRDPIAVPRCHFHLGNSEAHIPFPAMHPVLILDLLCQRIEPDLGV